MKVQPVKKYRRMGYPTSAIASRSLLNEVPRRWKRKALVMTALAGASVLGSCAPADEAPVIMGKVAVARNLTETDAREIATAEAKKYGVKFSQKKKTIKLTISLDGGKTTKQVDYRLDESNPKTGVGFDYVTPGDCQAIYGVNTKVSPKELAKTIKVGLASAKLSAKVKVVTQDELGTNYAAETKLRKEIISFLKWLKSQGVI